jgi:hypothetical protein
VIGHWRRLAKPLALWFVVFVPVIWIAGYLSAPDWFQSAIMVVFVVGWLIVGSVISLRARREDGSDAPKRS